MRITLDEARRHLGVHYMTACRSFRLGWSPHAGAVCVPIDVLL